MNVSLSQITFSFIVSDRCSSGETEDKSGQVLWDLVTKNFGASITSALVPDDEDKIEVNVIKIDKFRCKMEYFSKSE